MTYIIIAGIILAVGAVAEIVAGIFTDKMLKKREEGLDRRQDAITKREYFLDRREAQLDRWEAKLAEREKKKPRPVRVKKTVSFDDVFHESIGGENVQRSLNGFCHILRHQLLDELYDHITVKQFNPPESDEVELTAELWILEGGEC